MSTLSVENSTPILQAGAPDLPKVTTSMIVPDNENMEVLITYSNYVDFQNIEIAPSKGNFTRDIDPSTVPYVFGPDYSQNQFYPGTLAELKEPYILRDFRGQTVVTYPFQYNPVTKVLRVYSNLSVSLHTATGNVVNPYIRIQALSSIDKEFSNVYSSQFLNYTQNHKYTPLNEHGKMLIVCFDAYVSAMQPFVDWKNDEGIPTTMVSVTTAGSTAAAIKTYVTNYYNTNGLTFLLLVGDVAQCPTFTVAGGGSDPTYGYISGADHYQEILVGRFSAENTTHVTTQVNRSISYERNPQLTLGKFNHCVGIASDQGPGDDNEYDYQHDRNVLNDLTSYTYITRAELYDGSQGGVDAAGNATAAQVAAEIAKGAGVITYCGHGSDNSFVTTGFSNTNVNALTNTTMWPFIWSIACVNGNFTAGTCFAEAWLRATNGGQPTGAVATFMSTINQSWNPPMEAQDEMVDILVESYTNNVKRTFGGLSTNGVFKMNDTYADYDMTDTWHVFGDPSLMVRTDDPQTMTVSHNPTFMLGETNLLVNCNANGAYVSLTINHQIIGTGTVAAGSANISFPALSGTDSVLVTVTAFNYIPYQAKVAVLSVLYPDDAQTATIVNPQTVYNCTGLTIQPKVVIRNMGNNTLSSVQVTRIFDGISSTINWSGTLNSLATDTVTFAAITLTAGPHFLKVYTSQPNGNNDIHNQNDTVNRSIMVNNLPLTSSFTTATTGFCNAPASVTFANSSQNATTYLWDFGDGTSSTDMNPTHSYTNLGVYSVTLTANAGVCGNVVHIETDFITIGATPPEVHDTANCGATSFVLTANGTGTINWYNVATGGTPIATGGTYTTPVLSTSATYFVENSIISPIANVGKADSVGGGGMHTNSSYYLIFNCTAPFTLKTVKVYAGAAGSRTIVVRNSSGQALNPPLSATVTLPAGMSTVTLNFNIPVGTGYQLVCTNSNPNMYRSTGGITFPYTYGGLVSITGTNASVSRYYFFYDWEVQGQNCISARSPLNASINSIAPDAGFSTAVSGWSVIFTDQSVNPASFKWKFGDGSESTQQNPTHVYAGDGTYQVTQIVYNGCGVDSTTQTVTVTTAGIAENRGEVSINIYPNPSNHQTVNIAVSGGTQPSSVQVFNVMGSLVDVLNYCDRSSNGWIYFYHTSKLPAGLYYIVIHAVSDKMVSKLVITQ
jgi:PKD repeat protein